MLRRSQVGELDVPSGHGDDAEDRDRAEQEHGDGRGGALACRLAPSAPLRVFVVHVNC